jgi:hypothetical protein
MIDASTNIFKARIEDFHRQNGGVCYSDGSKKYYANGAYRDVNPLGLLANPSDPTTRQGAHRNAEIAVLHFKCKLRVAVEAFDQLNAQISTTLPQRHDRSRILADLRKLRDAVEEAKKELALAEEKFASTEIEQRRKRVREAEEERRQEWQEFHEQRQKIRI